MELVTLFISAVLINNIILTKYLGVCPFLGVSKSVKSAVGMGLAVIFVIFSASLITYGLYYQVLVPYNMEYLDLITFIPFSHEAMALLLSTTNIIEEK